MSYERIVIVGASLAGARAVEAMRHQGFTGPITVVGAEPELPYHRPPLSKELLGSTPMPEQELSILPESYYVENDVELHLGAAAVELDVRTRKVALSTGRCLPYSKLLIATGASPRTLDVPGARRDGVMSLRTLADARELRSRLAAAERVVVIGAGLLGLEIAAAARGHGKEVTVLERASSTLERVFRHELATQVVDIHARHGVSVRTNAHVVAIEGDSRVRAIVLADGSRVPADLVVVAIGTAPQTAWLRGAGLEIADGVVVDEHGQTGVPGIYAAGDVARIFSRAMGRHVRFEQYGHAQDQGGGIGRAMVGGDYAHAGVMAASTVAYGARVQSIGAVDATHEVLARGEPGRMIGFVLDSERIVGAFAIGRPRELAAAKRLVMTSATVSRELLADPSVPIAELAA